jgi:hypothetical protein
MISGEQLQSLAEISLYDEMTDLISNQNYRLPQNLVKISDLHVEEISKYKTIYIYTHFLDKFFDKFYNYLQDDTVLISHNSDLGIHSNYHKYLNGNKIKAWYCQNRESSHPKLFSIPIGLANSQWPHGNQELITAIRSELNSKEILVYKNFDISTNYSERHNCNNITNSNGIFLSNNTSLENYWRAVSKSVFIISPPGNGIDCHRIWEALYLRTIPIVKYHESFSQFKHLPILFVNNWNEVTIDNLQSSINIFKDIDFNCIQELTINYWSNLITNENN